MKPVEARSFFKRATELDPEFAVAHACVAYTYTVEKSITGALPTEDTRADCLYYANTAIALAGDDPQVLSKCSHPLAYVCKEYDRGAALVERAVTLNPNTAAWSSRGWIALMRSEPQTALESFETMLRLSPVDPMRPFLFSGMAFAQFLLGQYDDGRRTAGEIMQLFPHVQSFGSYIVNSVGAGAILDAKQAAKQLLKFDPNFHVSNACDIFPTRSQEMRTKIDEALRAAGLPE
jgi:adenylate cyclase